MTFFETLHQDSPSVETCATVIFSKGYDYENLNNVRCNLNLRTLSAS